MEEERSWEAMEIDCLFVIFSKLGLDDLSLFIPFVCRSWRDAARLPLCWRILDFRSIDFMPWSSFAIRFETQYKFSKFSFSGFMKLAVSRSQGLADELRLPPLVATVEDLILASKCCPKLRKLALPNLTLYEETQIPNLFSKWRELKHLEIKSKPSNFPQLAAIIGQNCKNFTELKMQSSSINKEDVLALLSFLPKLRSLDLSSSYLPKKELLLIAEGCRELEELRVKNCFGFLVDKEVKRKVCRIGRFECEGSKMVYEAGIERDVCDDLYIDVI